MRVYLGGLAYGVRERDVDDFLRGYSGVGEILMKNGFAFVEFDDRREAEDAIYDLNGRELMGRRVTVEKATGTPRPGRGRGGGGGRYGDRDRFDRYDNRNDRGYGGGGRRDFGRSRLPTRTQYRLIVSNLSSSVSWQDLKDYMRQAGEVTYADAHKQHKNEGIIEFASRGDMRAALDKLDGKELNGRRIKLIPENEDILDSPRRKGGRRSYNSASRSRSPSASGSPGLRKSRESRTPTPRRSASPFEGKAGGRRDASSGSSRSRSRSRE